METTELWACTVEVRGELYVEISDSLEGNRRDAVLLSVEDLDALIGIEPNPSPMPRPDRVGIAPLPTPMPRPNSVSRVGVEPLPFP